MNIYQIPVLSDNYIYLLYDYQKNQAAVVDPAVAGPVLQKLKTLNAELVAIFNTHHHSDHVGGNRELLNHFPALEVYASEQDRGRIPGQTIFLKEGDRVEFAGRSAEVFFVPGHTKGHIAYYFPATGPQEFNELFCGDTLFAGGCGRLFEGTPAQMLESLSKLRHLPNDTRVWCAHEYTLKNLEFAITVDPLNPALKQRFALTREAYNQQKATVPSLLGLEKETNPFLRWDKPALQQAVQTGDVVETFGRLRSMKDKF